MLNAHIRLIAPLLLALGATTPSNVATHFDAPGIALRKCGNAMVQKPIYYLDGRASSEDESTKKITTVDVAYITVSCLNPIDSTLMSTRSKVPGIPLVSVWTKSGPFGRVEPALKAIVDAQTEMFSKTRSFNRDVAHEPLPTLPPDIKMKFESTPTGWEATVWFASALSPRCHTFGGDNASGGVDGITKQPNPAGKIVCNDS